MRLDQLRKLQVSALERGAVPHGDMPHVLDWDVSGSCLTPRRRVVHARGEPPANKSGRWSVSPGSGTIFMEVPCRQCEKCRKFRANHWEHRCVSEINRAPRTWFGDFTMSPHGHVVAGARIERGDPKTKKPRRPFKDYNQLEVYNFRCNDFASEITKYFKRLRKRGHKLRYCYLFEPHESGLPHCHFLIHEVDEAAPIRKRELQAEWFWGFSSFKLVDNARGGAKYVTKYLHKTSLSRIRASLHYGTLGDSPGGSYALTAKLGAETPQREKKSPLLKGPVF